MEKGIKKKEEFDVIINREGRRKIRNREIIKMTDKEKRCN